MISYGLCFGRLPIETLRAGRRMTSSARAVPFANRLDSFGNLLKMSCRFLKLRRSHGDGVVRTQEFLMLVDLMTGKRLTKVPYGDEFCNFMARMTAEEIRAIKETLNEMIDGDEIHTAGWMPGSDWNGTPFQAIYDKAARQSHSAAAQCFGLMVWEVFMERPEKWTSGRFEKDGEEIGSRTYFRLRE